MSVCIYILVDMYIHAYMLEFIYEHVFFLKNTGKVKNIVNLPKSSKPVVDTERITHDKNKGCSELNHRSFLHI